MLAPRAPPDLVVGFVVTTIVDEPVRVVGRVFNVLRFRDVELGVWILCQHRGPHGIVEIDPQFS